MSHLPGAAASSPSTEESSPRNEESGYFEVKDKRSFSKLMKPYNFSIKRSKPSWSTTDLPSAYRSALGALRLRPEPKPRPRKDYNESKFFSRHSGDSKLNTPDSFEIGQSATPPSPPVLDPSLEDTCRKFLERKVAEQQGRKKPPLLPRARYVYGLWEEWPFIPDTSMEPHVDHTVCMRSSEEQAACTSLKKKWASDKAKGVHFPSVLKVRRKELTAFLEGSQKTNEETTPRPWCRTQTELPTPTKCGSCTTDLMLVPEGLNASDWLPLMLLRRAQRCERQQRRRDECLKARALVVSRALRPYEPRLAIWTNRGIKHFVPKLSPLTGRSERASTVIHRLHAVAEVCEASDISLKDDGTNTCVTNPDIDESDTASEYSHEMTSTNENSHPIPGVHRDVEVPDLKWVKTFRVPNFPPSKKENHRSLAGEIISGDKAFEVKKASFRVQYDIDKPLPPLPMPTSSQAPFPRGIEHYRNLRRSKSAAAGMLLSQKCSEMHEYEPG